MKTYIKLSNLPIVMIGLSGLSFCSCVDNTSRASVQSVIDWSPQNVYGKTIVFNWDNATERNLRERDGYSSKSEASGFSATFSAGNLAFAKYDFDDDNEIKKCKYSYSKRSNTTASLIIDFPVEEGFYTSYAFNLTFASLNKGKVKGIEKVFVPNGSVLELNGITFTIK